MPRFLEIVKFNCLEKDCTVLKNKGQRFRFTGQAGLKRCLPELKVAYHKDFCLIKT